MTKGDILGYREKFSPEEKHIVNRWLVGNAVAGVEFTGALLLFAAAGWRGEDTASFQEPHGLASTNPWVPGSDACVQLPRV